ncbi:MAG: cytochrome c [Polyangiaceae bacterium]
MRIAGVFAAFLALLLGAGVARAEAPEPPEVQAHRLVHLLEYVAADYPRAIQKGAVASWDEYEEQLEIAEEADRVGAQLVLSRLGNGPPVELATKVSRTRALVQDKAPADEVAASAASAAEMAVRAFGVPQAPSGAPDAGRGKALYTEHCATCHGETGRADTARAATLQPRPANFQDPAIGDGLTPFRIATTVRFGVLETAMVPFTFLSDADRWDLAFHVAALRQSAEPVSGAPTYSLAELAIRSDADLRAELLAAGIEEERIAGVLADLRRRAPYDGRVQRGAAAPQGAPPSAIDVALGVLRDGVAAALLVGVLLWLVGRAKGGCAGGMWRLEEGGRGRSLRACSRRS